MKSKVGAAVPRLDGAARVGAPVSNDKAAALRALLDEAGLVVESIEPEEDSDGFGATLAGGSVLWLDGDTDACAVQAGYLREDFTTEHDTLAAALGLPSAADVREMRAEVERLRALDEALSNTRAAEARRLVAARDRAAAARALRAEVERLRGERDAAVAEAERLRAGVASARWYSYCPREGYEEHDTEAEARQCAEATIEACLDYGEWDTETSAVEYGMLVPVARAVQVDRVETPDGPFDYTCRYVLAEVPRG